MLWWRKKKVDWYVRVARFMARSRTLTVLGGVVALLGGARRAQKRIARS
jgi:hypothetical protein